MMPNRRIFASTILSSLLFASLSGCKEQTEAAKQDIHQAREAAEIADQRTKALSQQANKVLQDVAKQDRDDLGD